MGSKTTVMSDRTFTTSEAARELKISAERVRQLADAGVLPCRKTGLGRLFDAAAVQALAAQRRQANRADGSRTAGRPVTG